MQLKIALVKFFNFKIENCMSAKMFVLLNTYLFSNYFELIFRTIPS